MEFKHFSHDHGLVYHQVPQGSEIHCSGCKFPGSSNVYVCWKCSYFLHEQCFCATRSLKHSSHPLHPLTLVSYPTYPSSSFFCNSCNLIGNGFCYCCSECEFDIHIRCAHMTNIATNVHVSHPTNSVPCIPAPNDAHNLNPHDQNHVYPPQNNPFPNYVPSL
ncbi:hypothetical protein CDL12_11766 [Handroanthus impetiginosus]|uniref:DC1 domain-containing protein n=1 Tax=Handroanthus impetiginosus TaxID=429701 RepID=A0A2G9HDQ4_9LAMI|nr:hypothetical protein CDL12_11766 [Handroanthus impetiginosus]